MLVGAAAEAAGAASQLYQSLVGQGQNASAPTDPAYLANQAAATDAASASAASQQTTSQPPLSQAASKLVTDLNALLLNLQAANGSSTPAATTGSTAAGSQTTGADPATALQQSLQTVANDLQQAGGAGHHHHHHHHGAGQGATDPSAQLGSTTSSGTSPASSGSNLFSQVSQALTAYASSSIATPSASAALLTA